MLVSSTDERLLNSDNPYKDGVSPFVLAVSDAGLKGYDDFMNFVICISVVSIGVSAVYGGSRTLTALAEQDYAPKIFTYIDRSGRPLVSVVFNLAWGALAYIVLASSGNLVFNWLLAVSALAALFTWGSICFVSHKPPASTWSVMLTYTSRPIFVSAGHGSVKAVASSKSLSGPLEVFGVLGSVSLFVSPFLAASSSPPSARQARKAMVMPLTFSWLAWLFPSFLCSGSSDTSGSDPSGSHSTRSISILVFVSMTGI